MEAPFSVGLTQQMSAIDTIRKAVFGSADGPPGINRQSINGVTSLAESQSQVSKGISIAQSSINNSQELSAVAAEQTDRYTSTGQVDSSAAGAIINTQAERSVGSPRQKNRALGQALLTYKVLIQITEFSARLLVLVGRRRFCIGGRSRNQKYH